MVLFNFNLHLGLEMLEMKATIYSVYSLDLQARVNNKEQYQNSLISL